jgi:hypothetical protein
MEERCLQKSETSIVPAAGKTASGDFGFDFDTIARSVVFTSRGAIGREDDSSDRRCGSTTAIR